MDLFSQLDQYSLLFWISAIAGVFMVGIAKSGFGGGVGAVATPLVALTIPVAEAAAILLPILIVADFFASRHYFKDADWSLLRFLLPCATFGILLGWLFFQQFSDNEPVLKLGIGLISILFVLYQMFGALFLRSEERWIPKNRFGLFMGTIAGFTSTLAHVGGPPLAIFLLLKQIPRKAYVGTMVLFFTIANLIKLIPYSWLGLLRIGNVGVTLLLLPVVVVGVQVGAWLNGRIDEVWFNRIIYTLLFITGVQLIIGQSLISLFAG